MLYPISQWVRMISRSSGVRGPGLAQDLVGNGHLPDVVEKCGARDLREQRRFHVHRFRNRNGEGGHALAVAFGLGVLQVERAAQGLQRVVIGPLELLEGALSCAVRSSTSFSRLRW